MAVRPHHQPSFHFHVGLCLCCSKFSPGIARHLRNCLLSWISRHGPALVRCLLMTMRGPNMTMSFVTLLVKSSMPQDISTGHSFMCECVCVCARACFKRSCGNASRAAEASLVRSRIHCRRHGSRFTVVAVHLAGVKYCVHASFRHLFPC